MTNSQNDSPTDHTNAISESLDRLRSKRRTHARGHRRSEHHHPREHGPGGVPAMIRLLEALARASEPQGVGHLGESIGVDQPRASRLVQQGVSGGLLVREADPDDARRTRIALTDQGRTVSRDIRTRQRESLNTALESFNDGERADLARLLEKLADNWPAA